MRQGLSLFVLLKRDFWGLFGAIWLLGAVMFLLIGAVLAVRDRQYAFIAIGLILTTIGGTISQRALQRIRLEQYLRREGLTAEGEVIGLEETSMRYNKRFQWRIRYQYADRTGARHEGSSGYFEPEEAAAWKPGDKAVIRFDPRQPARSVWVGRPEDL
jgi:hypothetical protein